MKTNIITFLLPVLIISIAGCKKSDKKEPAPFVNITYTTNGEYVAAPLEMYAAEGKTTNQDAIKSYMNGSSFDVYFDTPGESKSTSFTELTLKANNKASIKYVWEGKTSITEFDVIEKSSSGFTLVGIDSINAYNSTSRYIELYEQVGPINNTKKCTTTVNGVFCKEKEIIPVVTNGNNATITLMAAYVSSSGFGIFSTIRGPFNTALQSQLQGTDRIIIQYKPVTFTKQ